MSKNYYSSKKIRKYSAQYNIVFGKRSNGKTWDACYHGVEDFFKSGKVNQMAIVRRLEEDFVAANGAKTMFNGLVHDGKGVNQIKKLSKGEYTGITYFGGRYYLTVTDEETGREKRTDVVIAYAFSLYASSADHYKSANLPFVKTIIFDEFITRSYYLPNEFVTFMNLVSTIKRDRSDITIWMLGNTVNKYCPYFREMGLRRVMDMAQGTIDVYKYGEEGKLKVAVEYTHPCGGSSVESDIYFAFDNPRLKMITTGEWEIGSYPHLDFKYRPNQVLFTFFVLFDKDTLQCEVIRTDKYCVLFVHQKTTPLKYPDKELIYHTDYDPRPNWRRRMDGSLECEKKLIQLIKQERVYYGDNECGEVFRNWMMWNTKR